MRFLIIKDVDHNAMIGQVNQAISEGWKLRGDMSVVPDAVLKTGCSFFQVMVHHDKEPVEETTSFLSELLTPNFEGIDKSLFAVQLEAANTEAAMNRHPLHGINV